MLNYSRETKDGNNSNPIFPFYPQNKNRLPQNKSWIKSYIERHQMQAEVYVESNYRALTKWLIRQRVTSRDTL